MNKFNKGKIIGIACASLAAVSLVGVGFSSWVISTRNEATTDNVSVTVANTSDKRIAISDAKVSDDDKSINFDCKNTDKTGDIQYSGETGGEDLHFTITYNVTLGADLADGEYKGIQAYYTMGTDSGDSKSNTTFTELMGKNYFTMPISNSKDSPTEIANATTTTSGESSVSPTDKVVTKITNFKDNVISYTSTFNLSWGSYFNGANPGECLEGTNTAKRTVNDVINALKELYSASSATFTVTLAPITSK